MPSMRVPALVLGCALAASGVGLAVVQVQRADTAVAEQGTQLTTAARGLQVQISQQLERAASMGLLIAQNPAYKDFFLAKGTDAQKVADNVHELRDVQGQLKYLQTLFPGAVGESSFIDLDNGQQLARVVDGEVSTTSQLRDDMSAASYVKAAKKLPPGYVYQSTPYLSRATNEWVIGNAVTIPVTWYPRGVVQFDLRLSALQQLAGKLPDGVTIRAIDTGTGRVLMDSRHPIGLGGPLGVPGDTTFTDAIRSWAVSGVQTLGDERVAYVRMAPVSDLTSVNKNDWYVTASAAAVPSGWRTAFTPLVQLLLGLALPLLVYAMTSYVLLSRRLKRERREMLTERDRLSARMDELSHALHDAADGNLAVSLPVDFDDEQLSALAASFDTTLGRLRRLVADAQDNGVRLAQAATQLRATASQQAGSASEQSAVVAQTTATIEELAATAAQIAETAQGVARVAQDTLALTDEGRSAVRESVAAMDRITGKVESISENTTDLGEKINEVGRILEMIDDLSEQTNLLALNAAIEAARAGEHGRGFAVVASEVRKLAEKAQQSTAQIQGIVTEIQAHARSTVLAGEEGAREAAQGVTLAAGAVDVLDRISAMVDEATHAAEEISIATQQQRSASDQVVVAINQVSEVSRQYATGSKQTSSSAQEIASLAAAMQESISTFSTDADVEDHESAALRRAAGRAAASAREDGSAGPTAGSDDRQTQPAATPG